MTSVRSVHEGPVARITFHAENDIHLLGAAAREELNAAITQVEENRAIRVVVFAATGRTFLAGAEMQELLTLDAESAYKYARAGQAMLQRIEDLPAVTVAAIQATCAGGGCELALACDFRLAASAARIGLPETSLGLIPGWGGTVRASRMLGSATARRLILEGSLISTKDALFCGLIHEAFPDEQFPAAVEEWVKKLLSRGPAAQHTAKSLLQRLDRRTADRHFRREARRFAALFDSPEPRIGLQAFLQKQTPDWTAAAPDPEKTA